MCRVYSCIFLNILIAISGLKWIVNSYPVNKLRKTKYRNIFWKYIDISEKRNIVAWLVVGLFVQVLSLSPSVRVRPPPLFSFFSQSCKEKGFKVIPLFYRETLSLGCMTFGDKGKRQPQLPVFPRYLYWHTFKAHHNGPASLINCKYKKFRVTFVGIIITFCLCIYFYFKISQSGGRDSRCSFSWYLGGWGGGEGNL